MTSQNEVETKVCNKCNEEKALTEFSNKRNACKDCRALAAKQNYNVVKVDKGSSAPIQIAAKDSTIYIDNHSENNTIINVGTINFYTTVNVSVTNHIYTPYVEYDKYHAEFPSLLNAHEDKVAKLQKEREEKLDAAKLGFSSLSESAQEKAKEKYRLIENKYDTKLEELKQKKPKYPDIRQAENEHKNRESDLRGNPREFTLKDIHQLIKRGNEILEFSSSSLYKLSKSERRANFLREADDFLKVFNYYKPIKELKDEHQDKLSTLIKRIKNGQKIIKDKIIKERTPTEEEIKEHREAQEKQKREEEKRYKRFKRETSLESEFIDMSFNLLLGLSFFHQTYPNLKKVDITFNNNLTEEFLLTLKMKYPNIEIIDKYNTHNLASIDAIIKEKEQAKEAAEKAEKERQERYKQAEIKRKIENELREKQREKEEQQKRAERLKLIEERHKKEKKRKQLKEQYKDKINENKKLYEIATDKSMKKKFKKEIAEYQNMYDSLRKKIQAYDNKRQEQKELKRKSKVDSDVYYSSGPDDSFSSSSE